MQNSWDERYANTQYVYGIEPNTFFKDSIKDIPVGRILLPAEGEGRNAVYAAQKGWEVYAFDQSIEGQKKAISLAEQNEVRITYDVLNFEEVEAKYSPSYFDVIALIYAHLPLDVKMKYYKELASLLKPGGVIILEGFSKKQLEYQQKNPSSGGPRDEGMLFSEEEVLSLFHELEVIILEEQEIILQEGLGHNGKASVIRFIGQKQRYPSYPS